MGLRLVVVCALTATCSLFPDLEGFSGGGADAGLDTGVDVVVPDAADATSMDAGLDDVQMADVGPDVTGFCASNPGHTFCEDFDEPGFATRWSGVSMSSGSTVVESDAGFVSPPNELLANVTFAASSSAGEAYASKHFSTASKLTVHAQIQVTSTLTRIDPIEIVLSPPPSAYKSYEIHIDTGDGHLGYSWTPSDGGVGSNVDTAFPNALTTWHDVELDRDFTTSVLQAYVDGVLAAQATVMPLAPAAFNLEVGVISGANTTTSPLSGTVQVDNVLVDTQP